MSKAAGRSKPRIGLFSVGRNKTSPARAASTRRASLRRSGIRTEAPKFPQDFDFADAGADTEGSTQLGTLPENATDGPTTTSRDLSPSGAVPATYPEDAPPQLHPPPSPPVAAMPRMSTTRPKNPPTRRSTDPIMLSPLNAPTDGATMPLPPRSHPRQTSFLRRLTSKLRSSTMPPAQSPKPPHDTPIRKNTFLRIPPAPKPPVPGSDFTSSEQRQAALRARGLLPAAPVVPRKLRDGEGYMKPLSEQEAEIDRRCTVVVPGFVEDTESEAKKIREAWLAQQAEAASTPTWSEGLKDGAGGRRSDAMERASRDGTIGDKSPVRATFVEVPTLSPNVGDIGAGTTGEDFHTALNTSAKLEDKRTLTFGPLSLQPCSTPLLPHLLNTPTDRDCVDLQKHPSSSDSSSSPFPNTFHYAEPASANSSRNHGEARASSSMRTRKEKPLPIIVTSHRPSSDGEPPTQVIAMTIATPFGSKVAVSERQTSHEEAETNGAPSGLSALPPLSHDPSISNSSRSSDARSRVTTVPSLSPTRTLSSSGCDSSLQTPTTISCARDPSISRSSNSNSTDNGYDVIGRPRRGTGDCIAKAPESAAIPEEFSEAEEPLEAAELQLGACAHAPEQPVKYAAPTPRPAREPLAEHGGVKQPIRKSMSFFGRKDDPQDRSPPPVARTSSSMLNLRRAFMSSMPRRKSTLDPIPAAPVVVWKQSRMLDLSNHPASPTLPPPRQSTSSASTTSKTSSGSRRAVAPTMHTPATILQQTHLIADEESRRLSEMAFLC